MKDLLGKKVYCKRNGSYGVVTQEDSMTVVVEIGGVPKQVTRATFNRWYSVVSEETAEESKKPEAEPETLKASKRASPKKEVESVEASVEAAEKESANPYGIGLALRDKFLSLVKEMAEEGHLDITVNDKNRTDIVKYNGRNVFECSYAKKRFNVLCHPKSLTPDNMKRATKIYPKEWGWSLRVKFVFTELTQWPLMKTIIADGLFYRQYFESK